MPISPELVEEVNGLLDKLEYEFADNNAVTCYALLDELQNIIAINGKLLTHHRLAQWFENREVRALLSGWTLDRQKRTIESLN